MDLALRDESFGMGTGPEALKNDWPQQFCYPNGESSIPTHIPSQTL